MTGMSPTPPSRADAIAAWSKNRDERKASRSADGKTIDPAIEAWKKLGIQGADTIMAIQRSLNNLLETSVSIETEKVKIARELISDALISAPDAALPAAIKVVLHELDAPDLIRATDQLQKAGMPCVSERGEKRLQIMAFDVPRAGTIRTLSPELLEGALPWRLYLAVLGHPAQISKDEIQASLAGLPLAILDDMVDLGLIDSTDEPWRYREQSHDHIYLRARLIPASITADEAKVIHWNELIRRHAFLAGMDLSGDDIYGLLTALCRGEKDLRIRTMLPSEQQEVFDRIILGAETGRWPESITGEYGLWTLLSALWKPATVIDAKLSEFHTWRAFYSCYRWILLNQIEKAKLQIQKLLEAAIAVNSEGDYLVDYITHAEINNIGAYLSQDTNELQSAIRLLEEVADVDPIIAENLAIVRKRKITTVNDREPWQNPYLSLGLAHAHDDWKDQYRSLLKNFKGDNERLSDINKASKRIRDAELSGCADFFIVPIDDATLLPPVKRSNVLLPPLQELTRRTAPATMEELAMLRNLAAYEILNEFRDEEEGDR